MTSKPKRQQLPVWSPAAFADFVLSHQPARPGETVYPLKRAHCEAIVKLYRLRTAGANAATDSASLERFAQQMCRGRAVGRSYSSNGYSWCQTWLVVYVITQRTLQPTRAALRYARENKWYTPEDPYYQPVQSTFPNLAPITVSTKTTKSGDVETTTVRVDQTYSKTTDASLERQQAHHSAEPGILSMRGLRAETVRKVHEHQVGINIKTGEMETPETIDIIVKTAKIDTSSKWRKGRAAAK